MTQHSTPPRRFSVHARHLDRHHARLVEEATFEAAAVAYAQDLAEAGVDAPMGAVNVVVRDVESGHEHCFRLDLDSGETAACG